MLWCLTSYEFIAKTVINVTITNYTIVVAIIITVIIVIVIIITIVIAIIIVILSYLSRKIGLKNLSGGGDLWIKFL